MKTTLKHFINLTRYHWKISKERNEEENSEWSHQIISIHLASQHPKQSLFQSSPQRKIKQCKYLVQTILNVFRQSLKVTPSNRLSRFEFFLYGNKEKGTYKGICYYPESLQPTFLITDPNIITAILMHERNEVGEEAMFSGGEPTQIAKKILGNNILTCPATEHKTLQHFSLPHFTPQAATSYFQSFLKRSSVLLEKWLEKGEKEPIDISNDVTVLSATVVAENLLGYQGSMTQLCQSMHTLLEVNRKAFKFPQDRKRCKEALNFIQSSAEKSCESTQDHFLKCMKAAKTKEGQPIFQMDDVISMAKILFFAGQDSTSSLLLFLLYTLGQPQFRKWQEKLYEEFQRSEQPLLNFINNSKTLDHLFKEGLRFHPPAFTQTRETLQDLIVDHRFFIPKGSFLYLLHYFSQRDCRRWGHEAALFNPNRFEDPQLNAKIHGPFQYFSLGPTICLGRHFIMLMMKTLLMHMITTARWIACPPSPHLEAAIMLELKPHVNIQFNKRKERS